MGLAFDLIDGLWRLEHEGIGDAARTAAVARMIDTLGVALAAGATGHGTAATRALASDAREAQREGDATFWCGGARGRSVDVALANGMLCHAMDYDDTHTGSVTHPSGVIVPTALAVAEAVEATGRETLDAAVVGYEVAVRLGRAAPGVFQHRGFQGTAVLGPFIAATVAAHLTRADVITTAHAWGLAGSMAAGINEFHADGTQAKQLHSGWAAHSGILALAFARAGATGPATVIEGDAGVFASFGGTQIDTNAVLEGLGERFAVTEVATKPYPACHCIHAVLDAWHDAARSLDITRDRLDRIVRVTCLVPEWYVDIILEPADRRREPPNPYAARFSLPWTLARTMIDGHLDVSSFDERLLREPEATALIDRIDYETVAFDTFPEYFPGGIRITFDDGTVHEFLVTHNRGSLAAPMDDDELEAKVVESAELWKRPETADKLVTALRGLPDAENVRSVTDAVTAMTRSDQLQDSSA